ncbi:flagellin [Thalassospiraceae bacterium LMO-JJ14]|nr:flagellin [Thalassospiraceae bacterium LMO-JJ14]
MGDITLSAAVRGSLLSLQSTTSLVERTQGRLSTGLEVASAIDDPVAFFQAKSLNDRAFDFNEKKDGIDQGISTVTAALGGLESIEAIVRQLKGVASSLKSATGTQFTDLITQFGTLKSQIGELAADASYQGTNLIDNATESLSVSFSDQTSSLLTISAAQSTQTGLGLADVAVATDTTFNFSALTGLQVGSGGGPITVTYQGTGVTVSDTGSSLSVQYGTASFNIVAANNSTSAIDTQAITQGQVLTISVLTANVTGATAGFVTTAHGTTAKIDVSANNTNYITESVTSTIDPIITELDSALTTLRARSQTLGSNVALLQTRLDFTEDYVNTLEIGSGKLTLADLNEEGANLLALQTRQQLGISALAFAGQAEQGILGLFR